MSKEQINSWWNAKSETFSRLCDDTFTHGEVILTNIGLLAFFIFLGFVGWLEGGAQW